MRVWVGRRRRWCWLHCWRSDSKVCRRLLGGVGVKVWRGRGSRVWRGSGVDGRHVSCCPERHSSRFSGCSRSRCCRVQQRGRWCRVNGISRGGGDGVGGRDRIAKWGCGGDDIPTSAVFAVCSCSCSCSPSASASPSPSLCPSFRCRRSYSCSRRARQLLCTTSRCRGSVPGGLRTGGQRPCQRQRRRVSSCGLKSSQLRGSRR